MSKEHTVKQGETMASIAHDFGFFSFDTLWNHPGNAELKKRRDNPLVLSPGDVVFIPDKTSKTVSAATNAAHVFVVKRAPLKVRFALLDLQRSPLTKTKVTVFVDGAESSLTTDGDGNIEIAVKATTRQLKVVVRDEEIVLDVGHLDPVGKTTGLQARLLNLGYFHGEIGDESNVDETNFALRLFQADQDLDVTGEADEQTRAKLIAAHGS